MNNKFDELTQSPRRLVERFGAWKFGAWRLVACSVVLLTVLGRLASHAQPIQPEVLFNFPHGNLPHPPENPYGNLVESSDGNLYGTTEGGGRYHRGTVFKVTTNGVITLIASLDGTNGAQPHAGLTLGPDGDYYGTAWVGGTNSAGTVFKVTTNGELTLLVTFNRTNGYYPEAGLVLGNDSNLYGTTSGGGTYNQGTVFRVTTNGTLTSLISFNGANGSSPLAPVTLGPDGNLYGTTSSGGSFGYGTVFGLTTNGDLITLASFDGTNGNSSSAALTLGNDGNFYGTTQPGSGGYGTVFKVTTNGVLTRIAVFSVASGLGPLAALTLGSDGNFYGTTGWGGSSSGDGTIFRVTTNGALTRLVAFNGANGQEPHAGLTLASNGNFYGTTAAGGLGGNGTGVGTVFRLTANGVFTSLASFGNGDGVNPRAALTLGKDGNFYGTTFGAGLYGYGMLFKVTTNGVLADLASFNNTNGAYPHHALTLGPDGNFYGTTADGGASPVGYAGVGTVYRVTTNGTLTRLYSFNTYNNPNGAYPEAPLALGGDGNFYGTASSGGSSGVGTVFRVTTNGAFTRLVSFNNTNGSTPLGALTLGPDGNFYGTTSKGGSGGGGTIFRVTSSGVLTTLVSFKANGLHPQRGLTLGNDGNLYGLTGSGVYYGPGTLNGAGTFFRMTTDGTMTTLGSINYADPGNNLLPALSLGPDGNFYGITGGSSIHPGTVFQVTTNGTFATLVVLNYTNGSTLPLGLTLGNDGNFYGTGGGGSEGVGTIFRLRFREPIVIGQPASQVVKAGIDVTIDANVFGAVPMSAQWVFNDANLPGQTNTSLTLHSVTPSMSGNYALRVTNSLGWAWSSNAVLTVVPSLITNRPVTGITATDAVLSGSVTPGTTETLVWIEWGTDTNYGNIDGVTDLPAGSGTTIIDAKLNGLAEGVVYHYRIVAWNSFGLVNGPDQTFQVGLIYAYASSVLADQPLVYYRFEETNGTLAMNSGSRGEAANGTYNATVSLGNPGLAPVFGYSAGFNNTNSSVAVPALGNLNQFTIEVWAKPHTFSFSSPGNPHSQYNSIYTMDIWTLGALHTHFVDLGGHAHQWQLAINGNSPIEVYAGNPAVFPTNGWVHLAAAYDSATRTTITYVNGHAYGTNIYGTAIPVNLAAAHIGAWVGAFSPSGPPSTPNWFDGEIDEFAIYGTVLTRDRIAAHFQAAGDPLILVQPSSRTNNFGTIASFTVLAGGTEALRYQWRKDGVPLVDGASIRGAQSASLTLSNVFKGIEGGYSVVVTNNSGSITSAPGKLVVVEPFITSQPSNQVAEVNGSALFSVTALGTPTLRYQWLKNGVPLLLANGASLSLLNLQGADAGRYAVVVSNPYSSVTSAVAMLTVNLSTTDPAFQPAADGAVNALAIQADGRILLGGAFTTLSGQARNQIGRLTASGEVDPTFDPGADNTVYSLAFQTDGKILVGGYFTTLAGQQRNYIGRLNGDGSLDASFDAGADSSVNCLAVQADGKILVGGNFSTLGGQPRSGIGRLNPDGSVDATFNPGANSAVLSLALQPDGKVLVGGGFTTLGGQPRSGIGRLNADGSVDATFNPGVGLQGYNSGYVYAMALQADGKILVGGHFDTLGAQKRNGIGRLNNDGSLDTAFDPGIGAYYSAVFSIAAQTDGKILVAGTFGTLGGQPRLYIGRLNPDGAVDLAFNPGTDFAIYGLALQPDGRILAGGEFTTLGGQPRSKIGRINNTTPATQSLTYDGSTLLWLRSGSAAEVGRTLFEVTTNGLDWAKLGDGVRVSGGWQLTGVTLPPHSSARARGFASGGYFNASSWFLESYWGDLLVAYQPNSRTNNAETSASFSVVAGGTASLLYQWLKDGNALADAGQVSGAHSATLTLSSVLKADEGAYRVVVSNASGSITSAVARLTVIDPLITRQPTDQMAELNASAALSVGAAGTALKYQWFKEGSPLARGTNATLSLTNLQLADAGSYSVVVSNQFGKLTSTAAVLTVNGATSDLTFSQAADSAIYSMAVQADGKVLVGGDFTMLGGEFRSRLAKLNADGSLDTVFNPGADSSVYSLVLQTDSKILVGGTFTMLGGQPRNHLGRLNADGSIDSSFNPGADGGVTSLSLQADGKVLVGGSFSALGGQPRTNLARLNTDGSVDLGFSPGVEGWVSCLALQADGKVLVGGGFTALGGQPRTNLARLNPDGTLDTTFHPSVGGDYYAYVSTLAVQGDGRILVAGNFNSLGGQPRNQIGRLNADGSVDATFTPDVDYQVNSLAVQADGKILLGGGFTMLGGQDRNYIGRLNADGGVDLTFNPGADGSVVSLALQADGNILVGGWFTTLAGQAHTNLARLNNTGAASQNLISVGSSLLWQRGGSGPEVRRTTFEVTTNGWDWTSLGAGTRVGGGWQLTGVSLPPYCTVRARGFVSAGYESASEWFVEGYWGDLLTVAQPSSRTNNAGTIAVFRVLAGGTEPVHYQWFKDGVAIADAGYVGGSQTAILTLSSILRADEGGYAVVITNNFGSITSAVARLTVIEPVIFSQPTNQLAELNGNVTMTVGAAGTTLRYQWLKDGSPLGNATNSSLEMASLRFSDAGRYTVVVSNQYGILRSDEVMLTVNGATIDPTFSADASGFVGCLAVQPDGKILVGGSFSYLGGQPRNAIGRLNADGSLDSAFDPGGARNVSSLAVQTDGKILVGGDFYTLGGQSRYGLGRLNADGSLDNSFNPGASSVNSLAIQADGKILVAGAFYSLAGQPRNNLGRINADGSVDSTFNPGADSSVLALAIQPDGQIVVGGYFVTLGGQPRSYLARVSASGALDTTFNPGADGHIEALAIQADGKILVGGSFTTLRGQPRRNIGRLNPDGSLDTAFDPGADSGISCLAVQADGKVLVGGYFSTLGGQPRHLGRLNADGSLDLTFNPQSDSAVIVLALQADGTIVAGGSFSMLGGQPHQGIGRLYNTARATEDFSYDGSSLVWHRGGTGTEVWRTTFEVSTNRRDWTSLGAGTRVAGDWQLTGVSLPAYCTIRARGFTVGDGYGAMNWFFERFWQPGPELTVGLGRTVFGTGAEDCLPINISSRYGLTNLSFVVDLPAVPLSNLGVLATAPEVGSVAIEFTGISQAMVTLTTRPGEVLRGSLQVASLCLAVSAGQDSSQASLGVRDIRGERDNGLAVVYTVGQPGGLVLVGSSPLLQCVLSKGGLPLLILYGQPGDGYTIQQSTGDGTWTTLWTNLSLTQYSLTLSVPAPNARIMLFRAVRTGH